jgi:hypothetical protein
LGKWWTSLRNVSRQTFNSCRVTWCYEIAGLFVCLSWNIIAVTTAWIKGEGWCKSTEHIWLYGYLTSLSKIIFFSRSNDMVSCHHLLHSRGPWRLCYVVSPPLSCDEVLFCHSWLNLILFFMTWKVGPVKFLLWLFRTCIAVFPIHALCF